MGRFNMVNSYSFGVIEVDSKRYESDVIIYPDKIDDRWWRRQGHNLVLEDVESILDYNPDVLIVGTGCYGAMQVSPEVRKKIESRGIEFIAEKTEKAAKIFNELSAGKKVVAAFHLTC